MHNTLFFSRYREQDEVELIRRVCWQADRLVKSL